VRGRSLCVMRVWRASSIWVEHLADSYISIFHCTPSRDCLCSQLCTYFMLRGSIQTCNVVFVDFGTSICLIYYIGFDSCLICCPIKERKVSTIAAVRSYCHSCSRGAIPDNVGERLNSASFALARRPRSIASRKVM
jgi:hypothetical protein